MRAKRCLALALLTICTIHAAPSLAQGAGEQDEMSLVSRSSNGGGMSASRYSDAYDHLFRKYTARFFGPNFDWRWFKAQAIAESGLDPEAVSPVGAIGIMQIMPATYAEIRDSNPHFGDIRNPEWNIAAGIYYARYLYRQRHWTGLRDHDKLSLTFAGYNAGLGGALRSIKKAGAERWAALRPHLPRETRNYVERIRGTHPLL